LFVSLQPKQRREFLIVELVHEQNC
jgi:hypothetical protein